MVAPYDESLHQMNDSERLEWSRRVHERLSTMIDPSASIVFLAGDKYRSHLQKYFEHEGRKTSAPMSELGIGRQVSWLQKLIKEEPRLSDIDRFYRLIKRIANVDTEGLCKLGERNSRTVPQRGIYFFMQPSEARMTSPFENRIVRIGTHSVSSGSKATLWNRLRTHRGGENGTGNHRGSIFRLHVGDSLIRKSGSEETYPTWGVGQSASADIRSSEKEMELEVSKIISAMPVLWLEVGDEASPDSDRAYLERNLIALLSGPSGPLDLPSADWLGRWSSREAIGFSGLWNVNHVYEEYDPGALDILEKYVESLEGLSKPVRKSLAPKGWRSRILKSGMPRQQLKLV
ncbi:MAG: hypothetical protein A2V79_07820 [Betaproteobacteria bacterium RBG_16_56_24]|nr:MAG: hypothetical protein A2V79_07820 [Betaproteobacteria bacterium RBG_16_56_24]